MSSIVSAPKQTNGYFVATGTYTSYAISTAASGSGGSVVAPLLTATTGAGAAGDLLKDMGKTVQSGTAGTTGTTVAHVNGSGFRVFRKVQLLNKNSNLVGNGISGASPAYSTFYIELPVSGNSSSAAINNSSLVYVPGMPGLGY